MADKISGQITVATAGTEVAGPSSGPGQYIIKAHPGNTGTYVYVGNNGDDTVSSTTGMPLAKGEILVVKVKDLDDVLFDVDTNGDKVCWFRAIPGIN